MSLNYTTLTFKSTFNSDYLQEELYDLLDKTFVIPDSYSYNIYEITQDYIARPDLISYDAYGDTMYADVLCKLNGISNPFELNEGMKLIIPSPEDIINFVVKPNSEESESVINSSSSIPIAKPKQSKRKANEAVIGDSRFKIDSASGVVIY